ncbi:hypothetical protein MJ575_13570 [Klebsiella pneumoniae]|nr:hypothetical protein MJ575_13570 [Klebsiella pneumoniae]
MTMALGLSDIKAQMAGLVYRGFVTVTVSANVAIRYICRRLKASGEDGYRSAPRSGADLRWRACSRRGSSG